MHTVFTTACTGERRSDCQTHASEGHQKPSEPCTPSFPSVRNTSAACFGQAESHRQAIPRRWRIFRRRHFHQSPRWTPTLEFLGVQRTVPAVLHSLLAPPTDTVAGQVTCVRVERGELKASDSVTLLPMLASTSSPGLVLGPSAVTLRNLDSGHFAEKRFLCDGTSDGKLIGWRLPSFEELISFKFVI